jgi:hypothetical protein
MGRPRDPLEVDETTGTVPGDGQVKPARPRDIGARTIDRGGRPLERLLGLSPGRQRG